jgi:hypothetical protein
MIEKGVHHTDWLLVLYLLSGLLLLISKLYHSKKFHLFLSLPFSSGLKNFEKEFNPYGGKDIFDMLMAINSYLVFGAGLFLVFNSGLGVWSDFFRLLLILTFFFLIKNFFTLFIGWLFDVNHEIAYSQNANLIYRSWSSIFILPILLVVTFVPDFFVFGQKLLIVILSASYALALAISIFRVWEMTVSKYYKIFYLCALEITPLFFLVFWFKDH